APIADDAYRGTPQLPAAEGTALPAAGLDRAVGRRDVPQDGEYQSDGHFRHRVRACSGRVHHDDAAFGGGVDVDVVDGEADAGDAAQRGCGFDHLAGDLSGAAHDQAVVASDDID